MPVGPAAGEGREGREGTGGAGACVRRLTPAGSQLPLGTSWGQAVARSAGQERGHAREAAGSPRQSHGLGQEGGARARAVGTPRKVRRPSARPPRAGADAPRRRSPGRLRRRRRACWAAPQRRRAARRAPHPPVCRTRPGLTACALRAQVQGGTRRQGERQDHQKAARHHRQAL